MTKNGSNGQIMPYTMWKFHNINVLQDYIRAYRPQAVSVLCVINSQRCAIISSTSHLFGLTMILSLIAGCCLQTDFDGIMNNNVTLCSFCIEGL